MMQKQTMHDAKARETSLNYKSVKAVRGGDHDTKDHDGKNAEKVVLLMH